MIPMRYKIWFTARISNTLSYIYQSIGFIIFKLSCCILYLLLIVSERFYSYSYSHYNAYRNKADFCRAHTYYLRDGYGRRFKIYRNPDTFDPKYCRPPLPPRRLRWYR